VIYVRQMKETDRRSMMPEIRALEAKCFPDDEPGTLSGRMILALDGDGVDFRLIGFANIIERNGFIERVAVDENYRGRGLGARMVRSLVRAFRRVNGLRKRVRTYAAADNMPSVRMFLNSGFRATKQSRSSKWVNLLNEAKK